MPEQTPATLQPPEPVALALTRPAEVEVSREISGDVREFMSRPPHWLWRSGTTVLAAVLSLFLILSIIIRYPDTITGRITLIGTQPVMEVVARQSGHLDSLRVQEGQHVQKNEVLAVMQSPARSGTLLALAEKLRQLQPATGEEIPVVQSEFKAEDALGQIQEPYADFLNAWRLLKSRLADDYAEKAGALLRKQLEGKREQIASLRNQAGMMGQEMGLAREKLDRLKTLHQSKAISTAEMQEQEMALLERMRAETSGQRTLNEAEIEASKAEKELRDLQHDRRESLRAAREELRARLNKLQGAIALWEADYVLRAPGEGNVAFYDFWSDQQFVTAGRQVFLIVPAATRLLGRLPVSQGGSGKIKPGQNVRIQLDDFPYKEFGIVSGKVKSISMVARKGANLVLVDIPHPLVTSFHKKLLFKQEMVGQANIVTEDMTLLGRVLYEIRRAFVNNAS